MDHDEELRELWRRVSKLEEKCASLEKAQDKMDKEWSKMENEVRATSSQVARWKSAIPLLLGFGGIVGWLITKWQTLFHIFGKGQGP